MVLYKYLYKAPVHRRSVSQDIPRTEVRSSGEYNFKRPFNEKSRSVSSSSIKSMLPSSKPRQQQQILSSRTCSAGSNHSLNGMRASSTSNYDAKRRVPSVSTVPSYPRRNSLPGSTTDRHCSSLEQSRADKLTYETYDIIHDYINQQELQLKQLQQFQQFQQQQQQIQWHIHQNLQQQQMMQINPMISYQEPYFSPAISQPLPPPPPTVIYNNTPMKYPPPSAFTHPQIQPVLPHSNYHSVASSRANSLNSNIQAGNMNVGPPANFVPNVVSHNNNFGHHSSTIRPVAIQSDSTSSTSTSRLNQKENKKPLDISPSKLKKVYPSSASAYSCSSTSASSHQRSTTSSNTTNSLSSFPVSPKEEQLSKLNMSSSTNSSSLSIPLTEFHDCISSVSSSSLESSTTNIASIAAGENSLAKSAVVEEKSTETLSAFLVQNENGKKTNNTNNKTEKSSVTFILRAVLGLVTIDLLFRFYQKDYWSLQNILLFSSIIIILISIWIKSFQKSF